MEHCISMCWNTEHQNARKLTFTTTYGNLHNIMLSQRSQTQDTACCRTAFTWNVPKRWIFTDKKQPGSCMGLEVGARTDRFERTWQGWCKCSAQCVHIVTPCVSRTTSSGRTKTLHLWESSPSLLFLASNDQTPLWFCGLTPSETSQKWYQMALFFLCLLYFTWHNALKVCCVVAYGRISFIV